MNRRQREVMRDVRKLKNRELELQKENDGLRKQIQKIQEQLTIALEEIVQLRRGK